MEQSKVRYVNNDAAFMEQVHKIKDRRQKEINKQLIMIFILVMCIIVAVNIVVKSSVFVLFMCLVTEAIAFIVQMNAMCFDIGENYIHKLLNTDDQRYAVYINLESLYERDKNLIIDISDDRFVARGFKTGSWYFKEITVNDNKEHRDYLEIDWKNMRCSS